MRLAGTYHPIQYLAEKLSLYLPAVKEANALWMGFDKEIYTLDDTSPLQEILKVKAQEIRQTKQTTKWSSTLQIFTNSSIHNNQLSIEDESHENVLWLFFESPIDGLKDVILFRFPNNIFLQSIATTFKGISTREKAILHKMLYSIFQTEYIKAFEERQLLLQLKGLTDKYQIKIKELQEVNASTQKLYSNAVNGIVESQIKELEEQYQCKIVITDKAVFKIAKEHLSIPDIQKIIQSAVDLAFNFQLGSTSLKIEEDYIDLTKRIQPQTPLNIHSTKNKDKVFELLERYEEAAQILNQIHENINGKNIAKTLNPAVTPPAITDAVKKNSNKISYYLKQYPERWILIRNYIRPISLLDNSWNTYDKPTGS